MLRDLKKTAVLVQYDSRRVTAPAARKVRIAICPARDASMAAAPAAIVPEGTYGTVEQNKKRDVARRFV